MLSYTDLETFFQKHIIFKLSILDVLTSSIKLPQEWQEKDFVRTEAYNYDSHF